MYVAIRFVWRKPNYHINYIRRCCQLKTRVIVFCVFVVYKIKSCNDNAYSTENVNEDNYTWEWRQSVANWVLVFGKLRNQTEDE